MTPTDPAERDYLQAQAEGRHDAQLRMLQSALAHADAGTPLPGMSAFFVMFEWDRLIDDYPPARAALIARRDDDTRRLLDGDDSFPSVNPYLPPSRFKLVARMNERLGDARATHALFVEMATRMPQATRRNALFALPAILEAGDFALAEPYLPDPLYQLASLNEAAEAWPLYPPPGQAPRLVSDLVNFTKAVHMRAAALAGLGRREEAMALRTAALAGIASDTVRALARRELDAPGAIVREAVARQMAAHEAENAEAAEDAKGASS